MLVRSQVSAGGHYEAAITTVRRALTSADLPCAWKARFLAVLAAYQRLVTGDLELMDVTAHQAIAAAEEAGDAFAAAGALAELALSHSVRRGPCRRA